MGSKLEHVNITVTDCARTAETICALFGWRVRWSGPARDGGRTFHVGDDAAYVALYSPPPGSAALGRDGVFNHIGVVVDDLDAIEARVRAAGLRPFSHDDYAPGRRFYFLDADDIEYEVVSYAA